MNIAGKIVTAAILLACAPAWAATRDVTVSWTQELTTVDGDPIPAMGGFRLYDQNGVFISAFPGDARTGKARINLPWGQSCFKMRSYFTANGVELESADSNVGGCLTINPGPPVPPKVQ